MILGITGGTGCGKTTLLEVIAQHGGLVLDCDAIYHELLAADTNLLHALEARFPSAFENGSFQRKKLGAIVFADSQALLDLNAITHSAIKAEIRKRLEKQNGLAAIDAIALFESGLDQVCDLTVAVTAPLEARIIRLMVRDGISEEYARSRIAAQHNDKWFRNHCDFVLTNDADAATFQEKCVAFLAENGIITDETTNA